MKKSISRFLLPNDRSFLAKLPYDLANDQQVETQSAFNGVNNQVFTYAD
jgi:hypothetical protein